MDRSTGVESGVGRGRMKVAGAITAVVMGTAALTAVGIRAGDNPGRPDSIATQSSERFVYLPPMIVPPIKEQPPIVVQATPGTRPLIAEPTPYDGKIVGFKIPKLNVDAKVEKLGLTGNVMDVPKDPYSVGWYGNYPKPGFNGNSVFAAHVDYFPNILGPFNKLSELKEGDNVEVDMENGLEYRYVVISKKSYSVDEIPTGELISAPNRPEGEEWITMITCGGRFVSAVPHGPGEYLDRDVVVAKRVK